MGAPQIFLIAIYAINFGMILECHGKPKEGNYNAYITLFSLVITFALLISGGFFE